MQDELDPLLATPAGFSELMLGNSLYEWQAKALQPLVEFGRTKRRQNIVVVAPNGSGKDERVIPAAVYYWLFFNPRGRAVLTSKSAMQLEEQTIPNLERHFRKFGWDEPVGSPRWHLSTPTGGSAVAFVTNDGSRVEGFHSMPDAPLLWVVNEAKFITPDIWQGIDRCTPDVILIISSPGLREGRLYEACTKLQESFSAPNGVTVRAGLADCPHIPKDKIDFIVKTCGPDDPVTRSMLHGEFMSQAEEQSYCLTDIELEGCISFPPDHHPGFKYGFFDFADGQAENVLVVRNGNKYKVVDAWRDKNEDAVVGRAIVLMRRHGLSQHQCGADAAAKSILDKMGSAGFAIHRQNFGAADKFGMYKSWSAFAWLEGCRKIRDREVILPDDPILKSQLTTRHKLITPTGKLAVEEKHDMQKRNIKSPDRADALFGAMSAVDTSAFDRASSFTDRLDQGKHREAFHGVSVGY